jgi:hypothetical protein
MARSAGNAGNTARAALLASLFLLPLLSLLAVGCGKQGPPAPPFRSVPAPASDLAVRQRGNQLLLGFGYPKLTPAGTALGAVTALEVWSVERPAPREGQPQPLDPRELKAAATQRLRLETADLPQVTYGDRILVTVPLTEPIEPRSVYLAVRSFGPAGEESEFSNQAALVTAAPPPAPQQVTVTPVAEGIRVEWSPPAGMEGATGFGVYRRAAQERTYSQPLHSAGPTETSWVDTTARFGESYIYAVTALKSPTSESAIGSEHEVRYQDRFAPPAPDQLVALAEEGRVRLFWRSSNAPDLAGYIVYRQGPGGRFIRLTQQPITSLEFTHERAETGQTLTYRVTAVDASGNESPPSNEVQATVP